MAVASDVGKSLELHDLSNRNHPEKGERGMDQMSPPATPDKISAHVDEDSDSVVEIDPHLSPVWEQVIVRLRWSCFVLFTYAVLTSAHEEDWDSFFLAFLTNLSWIWVSIYWLTSAVCQDVGPCRAFVRRHRWARRLLNIAFQVSCTNAIALDILYWAMVYTPGQYVKTFTIMAHLLQVLPLGLDFCTTSARYSFLDGLLVIILDIGYLGSAALVHVVQERWVYSFMAKLTGARVLVYAAILAGVYAIHCLLLLLQRLLARRRARRPVSARSAPGPRGV
eukprot:tig00001215_g7568.t1